MATKDEKGFIRYTQEELNRIPPVEQRLGGNGAMAGGATQALGTLGGAAIGSAFGPVGTVVGGVAGAALTGNRRPGQS